MAKKRGRSVEGRRKATTKKAGTRRAVRASSGGDRDRGRANETHRTDKGLSLVPSPPDDFELFIPPSRPKKPVEGKRWTARTTFLKDEVNEPITGVGVATKYVNHPEVPTDDLFIAPPQSKLTNRELGFDSKGKCLYGCDGMRSIKKGYTNIACHHYKCPFWETVDGKNKTPF